MTGIVRARKGLLAAAIAGGAAMLLSASPRAEVSAPASRSDSVAQIPRIEPARTDPNLLKLGYQVYVGGLNAFAFTVDVALDGDRYRLSGAGESRGLLRMMWRWAAALRSDGRVAGDGVDAQAYHVNTWTRRGDRALQLSFGNGGGYEIARTPPDDEHRASKRDLPDSIPPSTIDPLSLSLAVARSLGEGGKCEGTYNIFDGDRRYDLIFTDHGPEQLRATSYLAFAGTANRCEFDIRRIMGFREKRENFRFWDEDGMRPPTVWVGRVVPEMPPVPVRLHVDLNFGGVRIYLVWAEYDGKPVLRGGERPVLRHIGGGG